MDDYDAFDQILEDISMPQEQKKTIWFQNNKIIQEQDGKIEAIVKKFSNCY